MINAEAGEIIRIPPGTFQLGTNYGDEEETEWLVDCEECGERTIHIFGEAETDGEYRYECTECGGETYRVS